MVTASSSDRRRPPARTGPGGLPSRLAVVLVVLTGLVAGTGSLAACSPVPPAASAPAAGTSATSAPASVPGTSGTATSEAGASQTSTSAATASAASAPAVPPRAGQLERHLKTYLEGRSVTASVKVRDLRTGRQYDYRAGSRYDSASVVKVAVMAAVLRRQASQKRSLTSREVRLLSAMIRNSDNAATSALYASVGGRAAMAKFYRAAGMTRTRPGAGSYWGLTQITASDQVVLQNHLTRPSKLLTHSGRAYARKLMGSVSASQRWGVSAGPRAAGARVELKNGWLPRARRGWRVHSTGRVVGGGRDYLITVLTMDNATMNRGIGVVEGASKIVWRDLAPAR